MHVAFMPHCRCGVCDSVGLDLIDVLKGYKTSDSMFVIIKIGDRTMAVKRACAICTVI